jgi:hypothetical protein
MIEISQRRGHLCGRTGRKSPAVSPPEQGKNQNYFGYDCTKKILYVIILTKPFDRKPKTIYHD